MTLDDLGGVIRKRLHRLSNDFTDSYDAILLRNEADIIEQVIALAPVSSGDKQEAASVLQEKKEVKPELPEAA